MKTRKEKEGAIDGADNEESTSKNEKRSSSSSSSGEEDKDKWTFRKQLQVRSALLLNLSTFAVGELN